ncbi:MBL fold metallo-hydrolase (plasmid) [Aminobacter sp. SR38]|uniref:MBL fold metallo-hydrolase n=1 Tax=Aminobacter sp. SR38 TaxID=2774562 RepID=UPI00178549CD|nr:MBL fold metallo-hydrolase [Aminobacter sp. SR38]
MPEHSRTHQAELQILGSGGPMHGGGRGSAAYLLRLEGMPPLVVDMGGDTPHALARVGVRPGEVGTLLISHLHPDHVSGFPDYFWGELTAGRSRALQLIAPPAGNGFPDIKTFWQRLFGPDGAYSCMSTLVSNPSFPINFLTAFARDEPVALDEALTVSTHSVEHGQAPTQAFRIDGIGFSIVFAGDQVMRDPAFVRFADGADMMVAHLIANRRIAGKPLADVVALPEDIGRTANLANIQHLVLSHLMEAPSDESGGDLWSLAALEDAVSDIRQHYSNKISVAEDLATFSIGR